MGTRKAVITGAPESKHVSTSYVERHNLTIRMGNRRFTRLTNAFSKKVGNHEHMLALFFCFYNFWHSPDTALHPGDGCRRGNAVWEISDIVALIEETQQEAIWLTAAQERLGWKLSK